MQKPFHVKFPNVARNSILMLLENVYLNLRYVFRMLSIHVVTLYGRPQNLGANFNPRRAKPV